MALPDVFMFAKATRAHLYKKEIATIKKYGEKYKLTLHKSIRETGWEDDCEWLIIGKEKKEEPEKKSENNISRARARIFELAYCNPWSHFITCTLDKKKYDRRDLGKFQRDLSRFIRNQRMKYSQNDLAYILIPELHKDKENWHMHGLVNGIRAEMLTEFIPGVHPQYLIDQNYRNWPDYYKKFGFVSLGPLRIRDAACKYIVKYITKDSELMVSRAGAHMFYASQGLESAKEIKRGTLLQVPPAWEFENDYVKSIWINGDEINKYI